MRCFVAVWPPEDVLDALAALPRPAAAYARWSTRDQWHVTLRFFGELDEAGVAAAAKALHEAEGLPASPLVAHGGPATRFMGPGLVVWPVEGLDDLARAVERATAQIGQPAPQRPFQGHVTLARARGDADLRRTDLGQAGRLLTPLERSWPVGSFALVESRLRSGGSVYTDFATFSLASPAAQS